MNPHLSLLYSKFSLISLPCSRAPIVIGLNNIFLTISTRVRMICYVTMIFRAISQVVKAFQTEGPARAEERSAVDGKAIRKMGDDRKSLVTGTLVCAENTQRPVNRPELYFRKNPLVVTEKRGWTNKSKEYRCAR